MALFSVDDRLVSSQSDLFTALYLASYESEGPENNMEKDRWKSLRCVYDSSCSLGKCECIQMLRLFLTCLKSSDFC